VTSKTLPAHSQNLPHQTSVARC